jgi:glycosyltransferase involved in cell wall biosynthesis
MPDLAGEYGRSRRRNDGIDYALANDLDWIFFLDADDVMAPHTFAAASSYIQDYDAIFGMIAESRLDTPGQMKIRENQLGPTTSIHDILQHDPFLTLQMGHFVRTKAAAEIRFDTSLDAGEDFKYYLELWSRYRCAKINHVLFINRRGSHSTGPRSADGGAWRNVVTRLISEFNSHHTAESK